MTEAVCMSCGDTYTLPTVEADTPSEAADRLQRLTRFPMCRDCGMAWDMKLCPDGQEHDWSFKGHGTFPDSDEMMKIGECRRCGVAYISPS